MGGLEKATPVLAGLFLVAGLATLGLPGLSPFVSEFLVLLSAFDYAWYVGAIAVTAVVLAAVYVLWMYQRTMTGPTPPEVEGTKDLGLREIGAVAPLMVALVFFGFFPSPLLDVANPFTDGPAGPRRGRGRRARRTARPESYAPRRRVSTDARLQQADASSTSSCSRCSSSSAPPAPASSSRRSSRGRRGGSRRCW